MNRDKQKSRKYWWLLAIFILVVLGIVLFLKNQQETDKKTKVPDIAGEKYESNEEPEPYLAKEPDMSDEGLGSHVEKKSDGSGKKLAVNDEIFKQEMKSIFVDFPHWFNDKNMLRKYLFIINDLSQNQIIYSHRTFLEIPKTILVKEDSQGLYMEQKSYSRYDKLANAFASIDVQKGYELYVRFKPLLNRLYAGFAYPAEYKLKDIFIKAAANVIAAPIIEGRIGLIRHSVRYQFADKKLEAMNAVKKQMLRMGPENTRKIQAKLRQIVELMSKYR